MELPDPDSYLADVLVGVEDLEVIQQAVMCCSSRHRADQIRIMAMEPFGPEGGCFGTAAMLQMQVIV